MTEGMKNAKIKHSAGHYEHFYGKYKAEVGIYVQIPLTDAFRHQCQQQKQFGDSGSFL